MAEEFYSTFKKSEPVSILFMVWTVVICIVGCTGNTLVIGAVLVHRKLRTLGNTFVTNLAVADFVICLIVSVFGMVGILSDGYFYEDKAVLCNLIGMVCIVACSCSMWSIAAISLNRYVFICHRLLYTVIYNVTTVRLMVAAIWSICFLVDLPNLVGWGRHGFDERLQMCTYDFTYTYTYTLYFIGVGFGIPLCVSVYCYVGIINFHKKANKNLVEGSVGTSAYNQSVVARKQMEANKRLLKSVLIILVAFILMWTPHAVMVLGDYYARWPRILHVFGIALAHGNSSINSLIYAACNRDFRRGYMVFLRTIYNRAASCPLKTSRRDKTNHQRYGLIELSQMTK
ncbi:Melatonin receptor type 1B-B [Holothuria leucospilota]|uniref:Melatonin receptor type 1B-B n=1 Tax=Holothuria leucospilota TaxID=206669 RepID=A0A9Q1BCJ0_HOLLE|nr:Melatonin receptor type 1B-B [Holothuria leucospilota]